MKGGKHGLQCLYPRAMAMVVFLVRVCSRDAWQVGWLCVTTMPHMAAADALPRGAQLRETAKLGRWERREEKGSVGASQKQSVRKTCVIGLGPLGCCSAIVVRYARPNRRCLAQALAAARRVRNNLRSRISRVRRKRKRFSIQIRD